MRFIQDLLSFFHEAQQDQIRTALVTVVAVEGSSYRRIGARMLVREDGLFWGGISGGCLEGDALKKARWAITKDQPSLAIYDTSREDDHQIGVGLGCQGVIHILFQPLDPHDPEHPLLVLASCLDNPRVVQPIATITQSTAPSWPLGKTCRWENLDDYLQNALPIHSPDPKSRVYHTEHPEGSISVCLEFIHPSIRIYMAGFQADTRPLGMLAHHVGFETWLWTKPQKVEAPSHWMVVPDHQVPEWDDFSAVVLMSHDFKTDKENLKRILAHQPPPYIGLLGPRVRAERLWSELKEEGLMLSEENLNRQFAPAGLDIGATTPEEIALSILAEIRAVFSKRAGQFLRLRTTPIHERIIPSP